MSGTRKQSTVKSFPEKCDEWLTTRNKRKASPIQRPFKKHKAYSAPLKETTRDNQLFLLTQNSPPPPQLKMCTKQSDIQSFFKSPNLTGPVQSLFEDEIFNDVICSSDESDEENFSVGDSSRSKNPLAARGGNFSSNQIKDSNDEDSKLQYVENEFKRREQINTIYKTDILVDSSFKRTNCGNLTEQRVEHSKIQVHVPEHRRDLILKDIHTEEKSLASTKMKDIQMFSIADGKCSFDNGGCEMACEQERLEHKQKYDKEDSEFTETEISGPDICSVAANKNSKKKQLLTCNIFACRVCCDVQSESLTCACSCDVPHSKDMSTDQSNGSHLINSEEADQELDNFSLSLNTQHLT